MKSLKNKTPVQTLAYSIHLALYAVRSHSIPFFQNFPFALDPLKLDKYSFIFGMRAVYYLTFGLCIFLVPRFIVRFLLDKALIEKYAPSPKSICFKCVLSFFPIFVHSISKSRYASPHDNVCI